MAKPERGAVLKRTDRSQSPDPQRPVLWQAAWGAVLTLAGGGAIAWFIAAAPSKSGVVEWPGYLLAVVAVVALCLVFVPLFQSGRRRQPVSASSRPAVTSAPETTQLTLVLHDETGQPVEDIVALLDALVKKIDKPRQHPIDRLIAQAKRLEAQEPIDLVQLYEWAHGAYTLLWREYPDEAREFFGPGIPDGPMYFEACFSILAKAAPRVYLEQRRRLLERVVG